MARVRVRFIRAVSFGADEYRPGDVALLDALLAGVAIDGRVAVAEEAEEQAVQPTPEKAVRGRRR